MRKRNFLIHSSLLLGVLLLFASSCTKDEKIIPEGIILGSFTDTRDGNVYQTTTVGSQVWMAENLKYLPSVVGPATGSPTTPYYYVYDYDGTVLDDAKATVNFSTYGVLYNWPAATAGSKSSSLNPSGVQGVCPTGWHLPSDAEWVQLIDYLGGTDVAGGKLKAITHWHGPNTGAINESGFTALPGGYRDFHGSFYYIGYCTGWWSATEYDANYTWGRNVHYQYGTGNEDLRSKASGISVRCVKDK